MLPKIFSFGILALFGTLLSSVTAAAIANPVFAANGTTTSSDGRASARLATAGEIWLTPHDKYSSSIGVLGCKVDVNHMAYWPEAIGCDDFCIEVSYGGRSVTLLRVDNSVSAHDISFENWNYLETGYPASEKNHIQPSAGFNAQYKTVDPNQCRGLIKTASGKLPFSAATSINYISNCVLNHPNSWVARNFELWNIYDSQCNLGYNEICETPDFTSGFNQAKCPHTLGSQNKLVGQDVWNILYPSGDAEEAKGPGEA